MTSNIHSTELRNLAPRGRRTTWLGVLVCLGLLSGLAAPQPAYAHSACCDHVHGFFPNDKNNVCKAVADCDTWGGFCSEKMWDTYAYCSCILPRAYELAYLNAMTPLGGAVPAASTSITYLTSIGPESLGGIRFDGQVASEFPAGGPAAAAGLVTLSYGSFSELELIPVTVDEVDLEFPPGTIQGQPSGFISATLSPGPQGPLFYNFFTGEIVGTGQVDLVLNNDVHGDTTIRGLLSADVDGGGGSGGGGGGGLQLSIQGTSESLATPVPVISDVGRLILIGLIGALVAILVWARRPVTG